MANAHWWVTQQCLYEKNTNCLPMTLCFHEFFWQHSSNYEILLSLVSVFMCSLSITDGVIWDEIFSKVTLCVGCMVLCCLFYCYPHPEAERKEFDVFWRFGIFWKNAHQSSSFLKKICIDFVISYGIKFYWKDSVNSKNVFPWQPKKFMCTRVCSKYMLEKHACVRICTTLLWRLSCT